MEDIDNKGLVEMGKSLIDSDLTDIPNMANLCAMLMQYRKQHWIGFYIVKNDRLELGPFQGPVACTTIPKGKGVCGAAWSQKRTIIVDDVHHFPGHIACSSLSNSEIVVPCFRDGKVFAVLDIDSTYFAAFSDKDKDFLEELVSYL